MHCERVLRGARTISKGARKRLRANAATNPQRGTFNKKFTFQYESRRKLLAGTHPKQLYFLNNALVLFEHLAN
jgi:hypothetical protein